MASEMDLSRRERQIMDIVFARGQASVNEVYGDMPDPPTRMSVRTLLRILEDKGLLKHRIAGRQFIYAPTHPRKRVGRSALRRVLRTFFDGSLEQAVAAHLTDHGANLSANELKRLGDLIRRAQRKGK